MSPQGHVPAQSSGFEAKYAGQAPVQGPGIKLDVLPWDIGEPQPALVALEEAGGFGPRVLDAGCGPGENAIHLARRGHRVTAFDTSPTAIARATERARAYGADVAFTVAEVTGLDVLAAGFDTVLDWGLYHCLPGEQRRTYVTGLHRLADAGATWHLFCFSESTPASLPMSWLRVSHDSLRASLEGCWRIVGVEETTSTTNMPREILERKSRAAGFDVSALDVDECGRILMPISHLRLKRQ